MELNIHFSKSGEKEARKKGFSEYVSYFIRGDESEMERMEREADNFAKGNDRGEVEKSLYYYEKVLALAESKNLSNDRERILEKNLLAYEKIGDISLNSEYWEEAAYMYMSGAKLAKKYEKEERAKEFAKKAIAAYMGDARKMAMNAYAARDYINAATIAKEYNLPETDEYAKKGIELWEEEEKKASKSENAEGAKNISDYIALLKEKFAKE